MRVPVKAVRGVNNRRWLVHAVQVGLPAVYGAFVDAHTRNSVLAPPAECKTMAAWMSRQSAGAAENATAGDSSSSGFRRGLSAESGSGGLRA